MSKHPVVAIEMQSGSSGKVIGERLAKELGAACYDKELYAIAAKKSGMNEDLFEAHEEKPTNSLLYSLVMDTYSFGFNTSGQIDMPIDHKLFLAQFEVIKQLAEEKSCVFVGRCADYALAEYENLVSVFISADEPDKVKSLKELHHLDDAKAKDYMVKADKKRSSYYNYYTNKKWGNRKNYDLCINQSAVGVDGAVKVIKEFVSAKTELLNNRQ